MTAILAYWRAALAGAAIAALGAALWLAYDAGRDSVRAEQDAATLDAMRDRKAINEQTEALDDEDLVDRLAR